MVNFFYLNDTLTGNQFKIKCKKNRYTKIIQMIYFIQTVTKHENGQYIRFIFYSFVRIRNEKCKNLLK